MTTRWLPVAAAAILLLHSPSPARAQATPELSVVGGIGVPGGTVTAQLLLDGDAAGAAVTVDVDLAFPTELVEFFPPATTHCRIDDRLAATHQIAGSLVGPGVLQIALFGRDLQILPVGDGGLVSCDFHVFDTAVPGATGPLTFAFAGLGSARGQELPVSAIEGAISIVTATPPFTPTPTRPPCVGDCNGNMIVTIEELIRGVQIVLGNQPVANCPSLDRTGSGAVFIPDMIKAVNNTLNGCS